METRHNYRDWEQQKYLNRLRRQKKKQEQEINQLETYWNLVSALIYALKEADKWAEENPELIKQNEKEK